MTNGRCRLHGGKTPGGIASPNWKHGHYSKHVPNGLRRDYEQAVADPELLSIEDLVAAQRARLCEIFRTMSESVREGADAKEDYRALWADARELMQEITKSTACAWKRLTAIDGLVTVPDVVNLMHAFLTCVRERVNDRTVLQALQTDWNRLVGAQVGPSQPSPLAISVVAQEATE
jgi:hypothetical protein